MAVAPLTSTDGEETEGTHALTWLCDPDSVRSTLPPHAGHGRPCERIEEPGT